MSTAQPENASPIASRGRSHRYRRPGRGTHSNSTPRGTPPPDESVPPAVRDTSAISDIPPVERDTPAEQLDRGSLSSRRGRGTQSRRRGGASQTVSRRAFGGQLTGAQPSASQTTTSEAALNAGAPEFQPGQPVPVRNSIPTKAPRARRMSKSAAPDIATRIHEDISNRLYECAICTSEVLRNSKIWSCKTCWTVFHLSCITKWSKNEGSTQQQRRQEGDIPLPRQWRCPGCNLPKDDLPTSYTCWCEKEYEPKPIGGLRPHSCGQTCGKMRSSRKSPSQTCPHPCE
jgi:transcriptional repressor NF-X1